MARQKRGSPKIHNPIGDGLAGSSSGHTAASVGHIGGGGKHAARKPNIARVRRLDSGGAMAPRTPGHCVGGSSKKGI